MKKKAFIFIIGSLLLSGILVGQIPELRFEEYTATNGLTDSYTNALMQDSHGFLWIGSSNGLNRFDGKKFRQYNFFGKNGLTDLAINCLAEDDEGNIWIGTGNGLNKLNPYTESIIHYYEGNGPGTIPYKWCNSLYVDKDKNLWLTTEKGIALYDKKTNHFQNFPISVYGADAKINKFINRILEDSKGRFWLATSYGIKLFDRETKTYHSFHFKETSGESLQENVIISLFEDHNGIIWAGTWGGGLLSYAPEKNIFTKIPIENPPAGSLVVTDIAQTRSGDIFSLLLAINDNLFYLEQKNKKNYLEPVSILPQNKEDPSVPHNSFTSLLKDRQNNIWASGANGVYKINPGNSAFRRIPIPGNSINRSFLYHIIPDIKDPQNVFYLSSEEGWWKYNAATGKIAVQQLPSHESILLKYINAWCNDGKGYWFTSVKGFGYYDIYNNHVTDLSSLIIEKSGQVNTGFITKDAAGKLWVTMRRSGILVYNPITKKPDILFADSSATDNIFGSSVTDIQYRPDGYIYFCAANSLYKVNSSDYSYTIIRPPAYEEQIDQGKIAPDKILISNDRRLLVSSKLRIYELKNDKLQIVFPLKGLSSFTIEKMTGDTGNNIYVSSSRGILKTDTSFKKWINISSHAGSANEYFSEINTSRPGEIFFNGTGQIGILRDSLLQKNPAPPEVIITTVRFGETEDHFVSLKPVAIRSSYKDAIEIELSAIDFQNEKENKIMYRLDGWDKNWKELAGASPVRYDQLPPGDYTFKAKTTNSEGGESRETILHFSVVPPFYRTGWFISLVILVTAGILFAIYRYRLQKAIEMERLRTRIATDLHDDIGATLSSISMYSDTVKQQVKETLPHLEPVLDKMGENSRDMVNSMSDIVWAINPEHDEGEKLILRMENYARDICALKGIRLQFDADAKIRSLRFSLAQRKNIYLIFKESVNNALKYSLAKNIHVQVARNGNKIVLTIQDDGKGFDPETVKRGNGLKNLYIRAAEIQGQIIIRAAENKGTMIGLTCPV